MYSNSTQRTLSRIIIVGLFCLPAAADDDDDDFLLLLSEDY